MESNPFFSIIIPAYNVERYISNCLDSILKQHFPDYELIVVNDESTDTTADILLNYQKEHSQIKIIHQKNSGPGAARNAGLRAAQGKYIWFIDSDDTVADYSLMTLHEELSTTESPLDGLIFSYQIPEYTDQPGYIIPLQQNIGIEESVSAGIYTGQEVLHFSLTMTIYPIVWNKIFPREFLINNNLFLGTATYAEDLLYTTQCIALCDKIKIIKKDLYSYHVRSGSLTNSANISHIASIFIVLDEIKTNLISLNLFNAFKQPYNTLYWRQTKRVYDLYVEKESAEKLDFYLQELKKSRLSLEIQKDMLSDFLLKDTYWIILLNKLMTNDWVKSQKKEATVLDSFNVPTHVLTYIICDFMYSKTAEEIYAHFNERLSQIENRITQGEALSEQKEVRMQNVEKSIAIITSIFEDAQEKEADEN